MSSETHKTDGTGTARFALWSSGTLSGVEYVSKLAVHVGIIALVVAIAWTLIAEALSSDLYIAPVALPLSLQQTGMSDAGVARMLRQELQQIRTAALRPDRAFAGELEVQTFRRRADEDSPSRINRSLADLPELVVPDANISLRTIAINLRAVFGLPHSEITAQVKETSPKRYRFHASLDGVPVADARDQESDDIFALVHEAAIEIESRSEPDIAALYLQNSDPGRAIAVLRSYVGQAGSPRRVAWALQLWGNILRAQQRYTDAIDKYRVALSLAPVNDPVTATTHGNLGVLYLEINAFPDAAREFTAANSVMPSARNLTDLAIALKSMKRWKDAMAAYRRAIAIDPGYAPVYTSIGNYLNTRGDWKGAVAYHKKAIDVDPAYASAYFNLAEVEIKHGLWEDALTHYQDAGDFSSWNNKFMNGKLEVALAAYISAQPGSSFRRHRAQGVCLRLASARAARSAEEPATICNTLLASAS